MRIGIVGLGDIARKAYLPVVACHADVQPILCTRNADVLARVAAQYRIPETVSELDQLIAAQPDAVMVHTATHTHAEIVRRLLNEGIPVFVDKPLSYKLAECEELLNLAAAKNVSLTLGFNRRFAPLMSPLGQSQMLVHARLQKNRTRLPDDPRIFIYDDFIHVLDSLRFIAPGVLHDLQVFAYGKLGSLASLQVQWQAGASLLTGSMNRVSGVTEERLEVFTEDQKWQIDNLSSGIHHSNLQGQSASARTLGFNDWDNTLYKRGFVTMFDAWLAQLNTGNASDYEDILATHQLCERVVQIVEAQLSL